MRRPRRDPRVRACAAYNPVQSVGNRREPVDATEPGVESVAMQAISYPGAGLHGLRRPGASVKPTV